MGAVGAEEEEEVSTESVFVDVVKVESVVSVVAWVVTGGGDGDGGGTCA